MTEEFREPKPFSPVQPVALTLADAFQFRCHKGIACFNQCCENTDILLMPYDIVRLKNRLDVSAREFIDGYTRDCELDGHGMPGLKLGHRKDSNACVFLTPEGCGVYEDRPSACRYYALGHMALRKKDSPADEESYFVVREAHCLGHEEAQTQTVGEYRASQGLEAYDDANREWRRIVLRKRSSGPSIGRPSQRSFELFFLASYDVDGFRAFVASEGFRKVFDLSDAEHAKLLTDEDALLQFGLRYLGQVLYGIPAIPLKRSETSGRMEQYRRKLAARVGTSAEDRSRAQDALYESLLDEDKHGGREA